ncbi:MAG: rRNA maturation RNase YbeY [Eubacterium sp.]|nr:rRNA maturation RNase YbeY [Eubacterium sp.]
MTVEIEHRYGRKLVEDYEKVINRVIEEALDREECPYECQIFVLLTDNEEIQTINREQRCIDKPTDVLSFPGTDYPAPACFDNLEETDPDVFHPDTGELMLGEIVISMDKVKEQAEEYGHSMTRELAFLTAHSMLHLMGYDHMTETEESDMEERQEKILAQCGYLRQ